jgi:hypothetical protein
MKTPIKTFWNCITKNRRTRKIKRRRINNRKKSLKWKGIVFKKRLFSELELIRKKITYKDVKVGWFSKAKKVFSGE